MAFQPLAAQTARTSTSMSDPTCDSGCVCAAAEKLPLPSPTGDCGGHELTRDNSGDCGASPSPRPVMQSTTSTRLLGALPRYGSLRNSASVARGFRISSDRWMTEYLKCLCSGWPASVHVSHQ